MSEMLFMLPMFYLMNQIDWTDGTNMDICTKLYAAISVVSLLTLGLLYTRIKNANNTEKISVAPAAGFGQSPGPAEEMTIMEYDLSQLKKMATQTTLSIVIVFGLYLKWSMIQPVFIQCFMGPMQMFKNPLFKIFILSQKGVIENRPFKEDNPFSALMPQAPATPEPENEGTTASNNLADKAANNDEVASDDEDSAKVEKTSSTKKDSKAKKHD